VSDGSRVLDRRAFLRVSGTAAGAMIIAISLPRALAMAGQADSAPWEPDPFIRIDPDGTVTLTVPRPDMGQGTRTSLPMMITDELDADWSRVKIVQADFALRYGDQYSGGSSSVRLSWDPMRHAGATTRALLVAAAAARWSVLSSECGTERGQVIHLSTGRRLGYGELAAAAALLPVPTDVPLKPASAYRLIGTRQTSVDAESIVRGTAKFGLDQRVPGMLFASIERAPTLGARVGKFDGAKALAMPGVKQVVPIDASVLPSFGEDNPRPRDGVAVIATSTWAAMKARTALAIEWTPGAGPAASSSRMRDQALALAGKPADAVQIADGNVAAAMRGAAKVVEAVYEVPLLAHTPMEPMNCVAHVHDGRCTVWAPCQNPEGVHQAVERALGFAGDDVEIHVTRSGGGFGRRFYADYAVEAALLSRAAGAPVQVVWTREDDVRFGFYRPSAVFAMRAGLDANSALVAWTYHIINAARGEFLEWEYPAGATVWPAGRGETDRGDFPSGFLANFSLEASRLAPTIPLGQWRSIDNSSSNFAVDCFFDEVAYAAKRDPLEMRLAMLAKPAALDRRLPYDPARMSAVFQLAAAKGDWGKPMAAGRGRGLAGGHNNGAYVAEVAEVTVDASGKVKVDRIVAAADIGTIVNLSGAEAQVQGAIIYGLSAALMEKITVEDGRVQQGNFNDFPALRMADSPSIEVHFVPSDSPPLGIGEGALPAVAPAVCNAIFNATGKRVRVLPIQS
jgi:isoquinoline 1-oxidoreductase beta subunit